MRHRGESKGERAAVSDADARDFYDGLGGEYDLMVSWETRLRREEGFFDALFAAEGTRRVLDAACGTGMHALSFARRGLACAGADLSPAMVERARANARAAGVDVPFAVAGFGGIAAALPGPWDAVTCLGNSLPHLLDDAALDACLADFRALLRPGGLLVLQNRAYDRLLRERRRFMPVAARAGGDGETLFLRITDFPPEGSARPELVDFTIVTLRGRGGAWTQEERTTPLRALRRRTLEEALARAGFAGIEAWGSYGRMPADAPDAPDLVMAARRR
jgi:SAM-dependent methyltransferase